MPARRSDPHGDFLPALLWHGIADRVTGCAARANARWGRLRPPPGRGRVVWIASGAGRDSVRLGVGLTQAIREKRLDLRLVLTFEREHADLIAPVEKLAGTGCGFAPSDHPRALRRAVLRLAPFALILAGCRPRRNLAACAAALPHVLSVGSGAGDSPLALERAYPSTEAEAASWPHPAPPAQLLTLLAWGQVDPNFRILASGGADRHLWWWQGPPAAAQALVPAWRARFPDDLLFVALGQGEVLPGSLALGAWDRTALPGGAVVSVDDERWLPALAASCTAAHFQEAEGYGFWQALGGGAAVSRAAGELPRAALASAVTRCADTAAMIAHWQACRSDAAQRRALGDAARRAFWEERRLAQQSADDLLERVFEWN